MNIKTYLNNFINLKGKTFLITGATGGIGSALAKHLAYIGADLIFASRNVEKIDNLKVEISKLYPSTKISAIPLDLCNHASVSAFLTEIKKLHIDYFFHNSGIYNVKRTTTDLGFDNVYQTNCLMPYYLTKKLLPYFKQNKTKVLFMGSIAYNYSALDYNNPEFLNSKKVNRIYGNSKRMAMFGLTELFNNNPEIQFSIIHPGVTLTKMTNHYPKYINWLVKISLGLVCPPAKQAGLSAIYATRCETSSGQWIGPAIANVWGKPKVKNFKINKTESSFAYNTLEKQCEQIDKTLQI